MRGALLALFLALPVLAQDPAAGPPRFVTAEFSDFSGGLVDSMDKTGLEANQSPDLLNIVIDEPTGAFSPRTGLSLCGTMPSGNAAISLYEYARSDGTKRLIAADSANVYATADCVTWTTLKSGLAARAPPSFRIARDKLWSVNGSTFAFTWDGTNVTTLDTRSSTPNPAPPKCYFLEYWKERVWCARTIDAPSTVFFSDLTDGSGNDLDPSTGTASWPAINAFKVDENGGCAITGLRAFKNRLYVFKDTCGIWEIAFNNNFDNAVFKTFASVGARYNTAITEQDGVLHFAGKDGFYAFDGQSSVRTSEMIPERFSTLVQPLVNSNSKIWTTDSQFAAGTLTNVTSTPIPGSITVSSQAAILTNGDFETGSLSPHTCSSTSGTGGCAIATSNVIQGVYSSSMTVGNSDAGICIGGASACPWYIFDVNGTTVADNSAYYVSPPLGTSTTTVDTTAFAGSTVRIHFKATCSTGNSELYTSTFVARGSLSWQTNLVADTCINTGKIVQIIDNIQNFQYNATGVWTSEFYDTVAVSTWSTFDATAVTNGGTIDYAVRVGTNAGGAASVSFASILPGASISLPTSSTTIQVRATLTPTSDLKNSPELQDLAVSWLSGGTNTQSIYAQNWKNRVWFSASSGTINDIQFIRSRLPLNSWSIYDMKIGPMTKYSDNFYVAASSWGAVFRADFGTNDYGLAIPWHWTSREDYFGYPYQKKELLEILSEFRRGTASSVSVGYKQDEDDVYTSRTVNMSGTGRDTKRNFHNGGMAGSYQFRVGGSTKDEQVTVLGLTGLSRLWRLRE